MNLCCSGQVVLIYGRVLAGQSTTRIGRPGRVEAHRTKVSGVSRETGGASRGLRVILAEPWVQTAVCDFDSEGTIA